MLFPVAPVLTWSFTVTLCKALFFHPDRLLIADHLPRLTGIQKTEKWDRADSLCYFPADSQPAALLPRRACISMPKPTPAGYSSAVFCWLPYESNSVVQPLDAIERLTLCFYTAMERPDRETLWGQLSISTQQHSWVQPVHVYTVQHCPALSLVCWMALPYWYSVSRL